MGFVNSYQTPIERRQKYKTLQNYGASATQARKWRDWTQGHIERIALPFLRLQKRKNKKARK